MEYRIEEILSRSLENWITIIGISAFGKDSLTKLDKYQSTDKNHCKSTHIHILSENDIINITEEIISRTSLLIMVADLNDSLSKKIIPEIAEKFKDKIIIGFFAGDNYNYELRGETASIVNLEDTNINNSYWALRFIPDLYTVSSMIGMDFNDLKRAISEVKNFKFKMHDFSKDQVTNKTFLDSFDISECKIVIFAVYAAFSSFEMKTFQEIRNFIIDNTNEATMHLSSVLPIESNSEKIKLAMLFG